MQPGTDYGDLAPLVKATGWLVSSAWAVILGWRGRSKKWIPVEKQLPSGYSRVSAVITAGLLGALWFLASADVTQGRWLLPILVVSLIATFAAYLINNFVLTQLIYAEVDAAGNRQPILGGLWLTKNARDTRKKTGDTVQGVFEGNGYDKDRVWPRLGRSVVILSFVSLYIFFTVTGSAALASGALLLLAARQPQILEFSITPLEITAGEPSTMRWRIANATKTDIEPFGAVVAQGVRTLDLDKNTVYTLTAENPYGSRGVQLGVFVKPAPPPRPPPIETHKPPVQGTKIPPVQPQDRSVRKEARDCDLVRGVVVRGEGWLQSDTDAEGVTIASCDIDFPRAGKYEMFVRYASEGSRPVRVTLNNVILQEAGLAASTGGWSDPNWVDYTMGVVTMKQGANTVEFFTEHRFPHIQRMRFLPIP